MQIWYAQYHNSLPTSTLTLNTSRILPNYISQFQRDYDDADSALGDVRQLMNICTYTPTKLILQRCMVLNLRPLSALALWTFA
jgi:hypothetical protein